MKKKRSLLVFLVTFACIFLILSIAAYAYDYVTSLPEVSGNSLTPQQSVQPQEATMPQGFEAQATNTAMQAGDAAPTTYGNGSTHPYGTWNNPYTGGVDGYSYTDPQDYTETAK